MNIAARTAAANPRRPTPAMPASPPVLVSIPTSVSGTKEMTLPPGRTAGANGEGPEREADDFIPWYGGGCGAGPRPEGVDQERSWPSGWLIDKAGVRDC